MEYRHDCRCEARAKAKVDLETFMDACPENRDLINKMRMEIALEQNMRGIGSGMDLEKELQKWREDSGK